MATVKKAFLPVVAVIEALAPQTTVEALLENPLFLKVVNAAKGGFSGEDSFITIEHNKVARKCAMTGAYFAHDNNDKAKSFFYKNGSYMIGGEVTKANARKQWDMDREDEEQTLEDQMLEGGINPKEWKEAVTKLKAKEFSWSLTDEEKKQLVDDFDGYETEEAFTADYDNDAVAPFTDYEDEVKALRDLAPQRVKEETEEA